MPQPRTPETASDRTRGACENAIREKLIALVEEEQPPSPSLRQVVGANLDVIEILRERGHSWKRVSEILAEAGVREPDGKNPNVATLRKYFFSLINQSNEGANNKTVARDPDLARLCDVDKHERSCKLAGHSTSEETPHGDYAKKRAAYPSSDEEISGEGKDAEHARTAVAGRTSPEDKTGQGAGAGDGSDRTMVPRKDRATRRRQGLEALIGEIE